MILVCLSETVGKPMVESIKELEGDFKINNDIKDVKNQNLYDDRDTSGIENKEEDNYSSMSSSEIGKKLKNEENISFKSCIYIFTIWSYGM